MARKTILANEAAPRYEPRCRARLGGGDEGFADEEQCAACHVDQAAAFAKSNHATAMAVADDSTVRANFDGRRLGHEGHPDDVLQVRIPGNVVGWGRDNCLVHVAAVGDRGNRVGGAVESMVETQE